MKSRILKENFKTMWKESMVMVVYFKLLHCPSVFLVNIEENHKEAKIRNRFS
jgi:hypothetical protein